VPKRLLLCDDDIHILRAAEFKLVSAGFEVRCAGNGQQAWERITEQAPDLLVTDYQMPVMNGLELIQRVRSMPDTACLPIIMLTAKGLELAHDQAERLGLVTVLTKPFSPRVLLSLVEEALNSAAVAAG
jgi:two-component system alkaline phosphatase synthesis response regulator PhoP